MANQEHVAIVRQGAANWYRWQEQNPNARMNLSGADLTGTDFRGIGLKNSYLSGATLRQANFTGVELSQSYLSNADLTEAELSWARLGEADLSGTTLVNATMVSTGFEAANLFRANLERAKFGGAILRSADLRGCNLDSVDGRESILRDARLEGASLRGADLSRSDMRSSNLASCNLTNANLRWADLSCANLQRATLINTILEDANLAGCRVYGVSSWSVDLKNANQSNLIISPEGEQTVSVDNLAVAQFIYLLLNNEELRRAIDAITSKVVLILGRFSPERKRILNVLREQVRQRGYLPVLVDFDRPSTRDVTETISTIAHLARFVIADLTEPRAVLQELERIVPALPSVPVQPILMSCDKEHEMFRHLQRFPWVLPVFEYADEQMLIASVAERIIGPAAGYRERSAG